MRRQNKEKVKSLSDNNYVGLVSGMQKNPPKSNSGQDKTEKPCIFRNSPINIFTV